MSKITHTPVTINQGDDNPVPVTFGDDTVEVAVNVAPLGALDDAAVTDPEAASASMTSLLRGILTQNAQIIALLTAIEANTEPTP